MRRGCFCSLLLLCVVACSGGGGGSAPGGGYAPPTATPVPTPTATPSIAPTALTNASGIVVDDANGAPLAGVRVAVEPWIAGATPLPAPQATTLADGTFALNNVPNGHYILVIGNDVPGDTAQTTVHDNVTLTGGAQVLHAPTLPPVPTITPPAWETTGSYRLSTIDATTEVPCVTDFNMQRTTRSLSQGIVDEWLTESNRIILKYYETPGAVAPPWPNNASGGLASGGSQISGGTDCSALAAEAFAGPPSSIYAEDTGDLWFSGKYDAYDPNVGITARGLIAITVDVRATADPSAPVWP